MIKVYASRIRLIALSCFCFLVAAIYLTNLSSAFQESRGEGIFVLILSLLFTVASLGMLIEIFSHRPLAIITEKGLILGEQLISWDNVDRAYWQSGFLSKYKTSCVVILLNKPYLFDNRRISIFKKGYRIELNLVPSKEKVAQTINEYKNQYHSLLKR